MTSYIWFERVLCADYDYIKNVLISYIYICVCVCLIIGEKQFLHQFLILYNALVEVNETAVYCSSLLRLQSLTHKLLYLIQTNRQV